MARVAFITRAIDEAGNAVGGSGTEVRIWDDFATTAATVVTDDTAGGTTIAQPITPNSGTQTTLTVTTAAVDTTITVASTTGFAVGQLVPIYDGTNTKYRFIRAILAGPPRLTLESAIGVIFSSTNTSVGNPDMIGVIAGWVPDTTFHYIQTKDVASTRVMPPTFIPTMIGIQSLAILEEGAAAGTRPTLNFKGTAITAVDNPGATRVDVTVGGDFSDQTFLKVGTNAASNGALRMAYQGGLTSRNSLNTLDETLIRFNADVVEIAAQMSSPVQIIGPSLAIGVTPAASGTIRIPYAATLTSRRDDNANNVDMMSLATIGGVLNTLALGPTAGGVGVSIAGSFLAVGPTPATTGTLRIPNSGTLYQRNAGNTANDQIWPLQTASALLGADVTFSAVALTYVDGPSVTLATGTWMVFAWATINVVGQSQYMGKLWDGTTVAASQQGGKPVAGAAADDMPWAVMAIVISTGGTYKISFTTPTASTGNKIKAAMDGGTAGNNSTGINAVKIA